MGPDETGADSHGEDWQQALIFLRLGEADKALVFFQRVVDWAPDNYEAWLHLGYCQSVLGGWGGAAKSYSNAIELRSGAVEPHIRRGGVYVKLGKLVEAAQDFCRAADLTPGDALIFCSLALVLGEQGKFQEAMEVVRKAIGLEPEFAFAHYELGWLCSHLELWPDAAEAFRCAVALEPEFAKAHYNLGVNYLVMGDLLAAMREHDVLKGLNQKMADHLWALIKG